MGFSKAVYLLKDPSTGLYYDECGTSTPYPSASFPRADMAESARAALRGKTPGLVVEKITQEKLTQVY